MIRKKEGKGCAFTYLTQNDPKGNKLLINDPKIVLAPILFFCCVFLFRTLELIQLCIDDV
jgi:hypothetical protein